MTDIQNCVLWPGWETVRLIGQGSFGAVYEIERDVLGEKEKAALKVISIPQSSGDVEEMVSDGYDSESITDTFNSQLKSIVNEYSLMRKMNGSANVVNCDDVRYIQHENGFGWDIFIKMELLTPLTKALPEKVDEDTVIKIGEDLCKALILCKKYDIVHRDIKPQNIFVSDNGDYKLGDFGIAKTVEKTSGGTKIGTYKYMAPEVYNNQRYGSSVDIYSLGLVLYWLLNERRMPFMPLPPEKLKAGDEEAARLRRFQGEAIPAPKNGSRELKQIVLKACAYDSPNRYSSAAEMLEDLESMQKEQSPDEETEKTEGIWGLGLKKETDTQPGTETEEGTIGIWGQGKKIIEDNPPIEHSGNNPPEKIPDPNPEIPVYKPIVQEIKPSQGKEKKNPSPWIITSGAIVIAIVAVIIALSGKSRDTAVKNEAITEESGMAVAEKEAILEENKQKTEEITPEEKTEEEYFEPEIIREEPEPMTHTQQELEIIAKAAVGDSVFFGAYEQDNDTSNGKEDIEWLVLEKTNNSALLLSRNVLDCKQFYYSMDDTTWENSTFRIWLNDTFFLAAFEDTEEAEAVVFSNIIAENNPYFLTSPGRNTQDRVFLLSVQDAERYFSSSELRKCVPTDYAISQGAGILGNYVVDGRPTTCWWLRSPGNYQSAFVAIGYDGSICYEGDEVNCDDDGIRPAIWVNLEQNVCSNTAEDKKAEGKQGEQHLPFYGVWISASMDGDAIQIEAQRYRDSGLDVQVFLSSDWSNLNHSDYYVITVGCYETREEAENAINFVWRHGYPNAYVKYSGEYLR